MKDLFPEYADSSSRDHQRIWRDALFVFDANVLLNLYRYQAAARDELLKVLGQLSPRIWISHHVALEFQRNRLKVIAEQNSRFSEVRKAVETARLGLTDKLGKLDLQKRHALINPDRLTSGLSDLVDQFLEELTRLQEEQQTVSAADPLKSTIEKLFEGRVGAPPRDQATLDSIYEEAEWRFARLVPPGYRDAAKGKEEVSTYVHGGLVYDRRLADYVIWKQLLEHAKATETSSVIFVTDDSKDDWWLKIESDGLKTIGPRPELIEEALRLASVDSILFYNPEGFLSYAKKFTRARVSDETLQEVRELSISRSERQHVRRDLVVRALRAERAVARWLAGQFDNVRENPVGFADFVIEVKGRRVGVEVKSVTDLRVLTKRLVMAINSARLSLAKSDFNEVWIVFTADGYPQAHEVSVLLERAVKRRPIPEKIVFIVGIIKSTPSGLEFIRFEGYGAETDS